VSEITKYISYPQLRYARQVSLFQLLHIDMVIQVKRFIPAIAPQLLDELPSHPGPERGEYNISGGSSEERSDHPTCPKPSYAGPRALWLGSHSYRLKSVPRRLAAPFFGSRYNQPTSLDLTSRPR
jgi:hypothetical protein